MLFYKDAFSIMYQVSNLFGKCLIAIKILETNK
jgi:hypothetical protein